MLFLFYILLPLAWGQTYEVAKSLAILEDSINQHSIKDVRGQSTPLLPHLESYLQYLIHAKGEALPKTGDEPSSWAIMIENGHTLNKYLYDIVPKEDGKKIKAALREFVKVPTDQYQLTEGFRREDLLYGGKFFLINLLLTSEALDLAKSKNIDPSKAWCLLCHFDQNFLPSASVAAAQKVPEFYSAVRPDPSKVEPPKEVPAAPKSPETSKTEIPPLAAPIQKASPTPNLIAPPPEKAASVTPPQPKPENQLPPGAEDKDDFNDAKPVETKEPTPPTPPKDMTSGIETPKTDPAPAAAAPTSPERQPAANSKGNSVKP